MFYETDWGGTVTMEAVTGIERTRAYRAESLSLTCEDIIWKEMYFALEKSARDAGVPFWRTGRLFDQIYDEHLHGMGLARSGEGYSISEADFVEMARDATRIPVIRPEGADDETVMMLSRSLCWKVAVMMSRIGRVPCRRVDDEMVFRMD